jgi:hypothetical protein
MSATAEIEVERSAAVLAVPFNSLIGETPEVKVLVKNASGGQTVTNVAVKLGSRGDSLVEITDGLKAGDRINISGVTGFTNINGINTVVSVTSTTVTVATNTVGQSTYGGTAVVSQVMDVTPVMAGHSAMCMSIASTALSGGTVLTVEGSDDGTTWVDAKTGLALAANTNESCFEVKLYRYMKAKFASWSAGVAQINLVA